MLKHFADEPVLEWLMVDSSIVRAHMNAAGASKKNGGQAAQALGRSRGGVSSKIHAIVDALGIPLDFVLTPGQAHDCPQAGVLLAGQHSDYVIADKGYDSTALI